jgi:Na+/H+ antiporter NhaD/arsenite permease-like protein
MEVLIVLIFVLGYVGITMEHTLKIDKLIPALLMMAICWATIALGIDSFTQWFDPHSSKLLDISLLNLEEKQHLLEGTLLHHFGKTAEILIFLMGAMAIVEMIDHFEGFGAIKKLIKTKSKRSLLWIISLLAFVLSAIIDNLTATIVLITILRKIIPEQKDRMWYAGFIVIAANAGGAWTPIGDVTTTMLWMAGKVTTGTLMKLLVVPSTLNILVPLVIGSFLPAFKGDVVVSADGVESNNKYGGFMLVLGLFLVVFVPVFKTITHLPPYIGMMLSLSVFAIIAEIISNRTITFTDPSASDNIHDHKGPTMRALSRIEMPSVLFFLGILMTVAAMESLGLIFNFGQQVSSKIDLNVFVTLLGASSAVIDNVPLVAASIGMFAESAPDADVWHFIAYAAGTGGSMLIIGSAAGVVAMGMEKITFFWYLKNITLLALLGYLAGVGAFLLMA